jgi:hypothetical protein
MKAIAVLLALALVPVAVNSHLRNTYRQTLAHWLSKVVPPPTVFIGDSIMTGGMWFDDLRNINLASNGLVTEQIAGNLKLAQAYNPKRIVVMAGMNDAIRGFDPEKIGSLWAGLCGDPKVVAVLVTPTKHDDINRRIDQINHIIVETCRKTISLDLADDSGQIKPEYALDGVHIGPNAYEIWILKLRTQS